MRAREGGGGGVEMGGGEWWVWCRVCGWAFGGWVQYYAGRIFESLVECMHLRRFLGLEQYCDDYYSYAVFRVTG